MLCAAQQTTLRTEEEAREGKTGRRSEDHALLGPFLGLLVEGVSVGLVLVGDLGLEGILRVRLFQNLVHHQKHLAELQLWAPAVVKHLVADAAIALHVGVVNFSGKLDLNAGQAPVGHASDADRTLGGLKGYSVGMSMSSWKVPFSYGVLS